MTEITETPKRTIDQTIENFGFYDVQFADISLYAFQVTEDDETVTVYQAMANIHLENNKTESHWMITTNTNIFDECKYCAARNALSLLDELYDCVFTEVTVFDEAGDVIDEFDLSDGDREEEYVEPTTEEHIANIKKTIANLNERLAEYESKLES